MAHFIGPPPSLTTTQINSLPAGSRPSGLIVYNTIIGRLQINTGTDSVPVWNNLPGSPTFVTSAQFNALVPVDGDEVYLQADATNGINWHLRYNQSSVSAYKWECLGGPPLISFGSVTVTMLRAGDYAINYGYYFSYGGNGNSGTASVTTGTGTLSGSTSLTFTAGGTSGGTGFGSASLAGEMKIASASAGAVITITWNNSTNSFTGQASSVNSPWWSVTPIRIS